MKHKIILILLSVIFLSSCELKQTVITVTPNLGNPLNLKEDKKYCVQTYNETKDELLIKQKLKNKLNVLGINVVDDCELKIVIEIKMIKGVTSKEIPIYTSHSENKKTNSNETRRIWNEVEITNYTENYKGIFLFIDLYNKDNILLDSVNSFSDLSNREFNGKKVYEFKKTADINYPIYASVNQINRNHILELDNKILKVNKAKKKMGRMKIKLWRRKINEYESNNESVFERKFYTRRCQQNFGDDFEMMSIEQLYDFMLKNSFDKFMSINTFSKTEKVMFWNENLKKFNYVYFHEPKCMDELVCVKEGISSAVYKDCLKYHAPDESNLMCKDSNNQLTRFVDKIFGFKPFIKNGIITDKVPDGMINRVSDMNAMLKDKNGSAFLSSKDSLEWHYPGDKVYSQYFDNYKTYVYTMGSRWETNHEKLIHFDGLYLCTSKSLKSSNLGDSRDLIDEQLINTLTYIKINVK